MATAKKVVKKAAPKKAAVKKAAPAKKEPTAKKHTGPTVIIHDLSPDVKELFKLLIAAIGSGGRVVPGNFAASSGGAATTVTHKDEPSTPASKKTAVAGTGKIKTKVAEETTDISLTMIREKFTELGEDRIPEILELLEKYGAESGQTLDAALYTDFWAELNEL